MSSTRRPRRSRIGIAAIAAVTLGVATVATLSARALGAGDASPPPMTERSPQRERQVIDFTRDWRFALANPDGIDVPPEFADAHLPAYDDSGWRRLDVPHDWSIELDPRPGPGTSAGTGFLPGGLGFYRKSFALSLSSPATASRSSSTAST